MTTLLIDDSLQVSLLREGEWISRLLTACNEPHETVSGVYDRPRLDPQRHTRLLIGGSEASVSENAPWIREQIELVREAACRGLPIFGICFGHQLIARALCGDAAVGRAPQPELGWFEIEQVEPDGLLKGFPERFVAMQTHFDQVRDPGPEFRVLARSADCAVQAIGHRRLPIWGVQFHPEIGRLSGLKLLAASRVSNPRAPQRLERILACEQRIGVRVMRNFIEASAPYVRAARA